MPEPFLMWINTLILLFTSIVFITAQSAAKKNQFENVKKRLLVVGGLSLAFLIGQLLVWMQLINLGYYVSNNPANAYFYVFTTLHGLHILGGLIYWFITLRNVWKVNDIVIRKAKHTTELCAIYWHFLLAVWIVLFGLMLFS